MRQLYHASSWEELAVVVPGDTVTLRPGSQGAQGRGVYCSEGRPDIRASDSVLLRGLAAVVTWSAASTQLQGWWRSKGSADRKKARPRTWHSAGRDVTLRVLAVSTRDGVRLVEAELAR